jgi:hypothetical protein
MTLRPVTLDSRTALVVSADPAVRADWARHFEGLGMRTVRCVGPQVSCALLGGKTCPLHAEADLAIYDRATVTPEFTLRLMRANRAVPIAFAHDRLDGAGRHAPLVTVVLPRGHDNGCIGLAADRLGR